MTNKLKTQNWTETKEEILSSLAKSVNPEDKESWGTVIEHVRSRFMKNDGRLMKILFYYQTLKPFIFAWVIVSGLLFYFPAVFLWQLFKAL